MCIARLDPPPLPPKKTWLMTLCLVHSNKNEGSNLKDTPYCLDGILKNAFYSPSVQDIFDFWLTGKQPGGL